MPIGKPIEELFQELFQALKNWGVSIHTLHNYDYEGVRFIRTYYNDAGIDAYDETLMAQIVTEAERKRNDGIITECVYKGVKKISGYLENYSDGFHWRRIPQNPKIELTTEYYSKLLEHYGLYEFALGIRGADRIRNRRCRRSR